MILVPFSIHVCGNCCMNLGNPLKILMNYLPIGGMTCLSHRDSFPMVNALVWMVVHWIKPILNHNISYRVVMIHQATMLCELSAIKEYQPSLRGIQ